MTSPVVKQTPYFFFKTDENTIISLMEDNSSMTNNELRIAVKEKWKSMDSDERQPFIKKAQLATRDLTEDATEDVTEDATEKVIKKMKKARSAYILFITNEENKKKATEQEGPDCKGKHMVSYLAELWSNLSNEDKEPWEKLHIEEREELEKNPIYVEKTVVSKTKKVRQKRAASSFIQYSSDPNIKSKLVEDFPDIPPKERRSKLAEQWSQLTDEEKKPWVDKFLLEKKDREENPQFIHTPVSPVASPVMSEDKIELLIQKVMELTREVENLKARELERQQQTDTEVKDSE